MAELDPRPAPARIDLGDEPPFELGRLRVLPSELVVLMDGERRELQPRIMRVLVALSKASPSVLSRDRLVEQCWDGQVVGDDALNRCILALRHLAGECEPPQFTIETVPRVGHRLLKANSGPGKVSQLERASRARLAVIGAVTLAVLGSLSLAVLGDWRSSRSRVPTVLIIAAAKDAPSAMLARAVALDLGRLAQAAGGMRLLESSSLSGQKPDLVLQVQQTAGHAGVSATAAMIAPAQGAILWSRQFNNSPGSSSNLNEQIAFSAARALGCADEAMTGPNGPVEEELKLYLNACAALGDSSADPEKIVPMLRSVLANRPRFISAWAKLLQAETDESYETAELQRQPRRGRVLSDIAAARRQQPYLAEAYIAESALRPPADLLGRSQLLDAAVEHNPDHAGARIERAVFLQSVGRITDALRDAQKAVSLDPLSPDARDAYSTILAVANRPDAARVQLNEAERLWPGAAIVIMARYRFEMRFGDPREALRLLRSGAVVTDGAQIQEAFLEARIAPSPENVEKAIRLGRNALSLDARAIDGQLQTLAQFGRKDELVAVLSNWHRMDLVDSIYGVVFRPAFSSLHHDRRFITIAARLGLLNYWRATGEWPDFCAAPDLPYECRALAAAAT